MSTNESADASRGEAGVARGSSGGSPDISADQAGVAAEISGRLDRVGVTLTGSESAEELVALLEAVDRFEGAVMWAGGDRMVDEPVEGSNSSSSPDDPQFVLPTRRHDEGVAAFVQRIGEATSRVQSIAARTSQQEPRAGAS